MKHYILAKFIPGVDREEVLPRICEIFGMADQIPGIYGAEVLPCCIDRPNRMDVMIVISMDKQALPLYDDSRMHHLWLDEFSPLIEKKSIFDHE